MLQPGVILQKSGSRTGWSVSVRRGTVLFSLPPLPLLSHRQSDSYHLLVNFNLLQLCEAQTLFPEICSVDELDRVVQDKAGLAGSVGSVLQQIEVSANLRPLAAVTRTGQLTLNLREQLSADL